MALILETNLQQLAVRRGKVRDIYDLGDRILMVSTDRISAFDYILPNGIPDRGRVLTQVSRFWFDHFDVPHHLLTTQVTADDVPAGTDLDMLDGRSMIVKKCEVLPIECVIRGYLDGSAWAEYQETGSVCGIALPPGLQQCQQLEQPIFTPATKAETGHDINISFAEVVETVGQQAAEMLRERSMDIYLRGAEYARTKGIIIADTKFEWGWCDGEMILIDEVLTPDSSRFWPADQYEPGHGQASFDKQFVRDWLTNSGWDKNSPPPQLPDDIVAKTREKYISVFERLTSQTFAWR